MTETRKTLVQAVAEYDAMDDAARRQAFVLAYADAMAVPTLWALHEASRATIESACGALLRIGAP